MASDPRRTPLKSKPLRNPGQSLQQQREELITDKVLWPMMVAVMVIIVAGLEWFRFFHPLPPQPWVMTFIAVLGILYSVWTIKRNAPRIKALKLAEEGEKAVGQYLEKFREFGYQIFHDVMGDDFNVDHVLIGPAGVFTVETKTWKKPAKGSPRISFDGECLKADGIVPSRDPVVQAKAQASWLRALLEESTGKRFPVRPVVLFPGWYVEASRDTRNEVWVLEPKAFRKFIELEGQDLAPDEAAMAAFHLGRYVRAKQKALERA